MNYKHGHGSKMNRSREYRAWESMIRRCNNPNDHHFCYYGGRGITVCPEWQGTDGFVQFLSDLGRCPSTNYTLERQRNSGGYSPNNCCWATCIEQANNKRNNFLITYNGKTMTAAMWGREVGTSSSLIRQRIVRYGWDVEAALTYPNPGRGGHLDHFGLPRHPSRRVVAGAEESSIRGISNS